MAIMVEPVGPPDPGEELGPIWKRLAWFAGIALASVAGVAAMAYLLRAFLFI